MHLTIRALVYGFLLTATQINAQINGVSSLEPKDLDTSPRFLFCDTIFSFEVADTWPTGIAFDGRNLWCGGSENPLIYKHTLGGAIIDAIPNPSNVYGTQGLAFDGEYLWALAEEIDMMFKLDTSTGEILHQFPLPLNTEGFGLDFDGQYLWATDYVNQNLIKIDTTSGAVLQTIALERSIIDIKFINSELFGISKVEETFYKIDPINGTMLDSIEWCIPYPLGITWDGKYLWNISSKIIFGGNQRAYKLDLGAFTSATQAPYSSNALQLVLTPNPASETLRLQIQDDLLGAPYSIADACGRHLMSGKLSSPSISLDISHLPTGVYFLKTGRTEAQRFVVAGH